MTTRERDRLEDLELAFPIGGSTPPEVWQPARQRSGARFPELPKRVIRSLRLTQVYADNHQATLMIGPVGVVVWRGESTREGVARVRKLGELLARQAARPLGLIDIIEPTADVPCLSVRMLHSKVNDELYANGVAGFAGVVAEVTAWSCGILTGLTQMTRFRYPFRSFRSTLDACIWLGGTLGGTLMDWRTIAREIEGASSPLATLGRDCHHS